jgi:probable F420-dependent oxidoreductase
MKLDLFAMATNPSDVAPFAREVEDAGFAGLWLPETRNNPYVLSALAGTAAENLLIGTNVAIALARSPFVTAQAAWDLAQLTGGRFVLGLGTQVKAHLEKRFAVPSDRPVARLREYILALRAIWDAFQGRAPLRFEGEFYRHTLLTEFFSGGPIDHPDIPVYVAGVNHALAKITGEVADGFCGHPVNSPHLLETVVLPAIEIVMPVFVAAGDDLDSPDVRAQRLALKTQLGFYGTTPSYRPAFTAHGFGDLPDALIAAARTRDPANVAAAVSDEVLDTYAVTATWDDLAGALVKRFDGLAARVLPYCSTNPFDDPATAEKWSVVARRING